jgi:uncharacterized membrane protein
MLMGRNGPIAVRVVVAAVLGLACALAVAAPWGWPYAPPLGWIVAAVVYAGWTWLTVGRMSPHETQTHATCEDPTRALSEPILLLASIASLAGVVYLLTAGPVGTLRGDVAAGVGIASVASAWFVVHTVFALRYARLYYGGTPGGIEFNQSEPPSYLEFAYLAFTIGMTFQVSDTNLQTRAIRGTALRQALLSYLLGAVVLGTVINLVAGLGH